LPLDADIGAAQAAAIALITVGRLVQNRGHYTDPRPEFHTPVKHIIVKSDSAALVKMMQRLPTEVRTAGWEGQKLVQDDRIYLWKFLVKLVNVLEKNDDEVGVEFWFVTPFDNSLAHDLARSVLGTKGSITNPPLAAPKTGRSNSLAHVGQPRPFEDTRGPLPDGWQRHDDIYGRTYYADSNTRTISFKRPGGRNSEG
jgi:hypothetical protein